MRTTRSTKVRTAVIAIVAALMMLGVVRHASAQRTKSMTHDEFQALFDEVKNWGRWGEKDELGALNLITDQKRQQAAQLVKKGISISLTRDAATKRAPDNQSPFVRTIVPLPPPLNKQWSMDWYSVAYHGFGHTHIDAFRHVSTNGKLYNGFLRSDVLEAGSQRLSIVNLKAGIFTRGVLIDIPRLRGVEFLDDATAIFPDELERWEQRFGKVESGDIVFVRTGRWARRKELGPWNPQAKVPGLAGLHASCASWMKQRDIAMLGSDGENYVLPSGVAGVAWPVHQLTLNALGVHIIDNCDLEELSQQAFDLKCWEFLLTVAPLAVKEGTGSPLNPIATF